MKRAAALALAAGLLMSAPAWAQPGRAQIAVTAPINIVKSHLISDMMGRGFSIMADTPNMVTFGKISDNFAANLFFGTRAGGAPQSRVTFSLVEIGGQTKVMGDIALIGNPGTAYERRTDLNSGRDLAELQAVLNIIAANSAAATPAATTP